MSNINVNQSYTVSSDERIIEMYWQREEKAIQETDKKYGAFLFRLAYNILHNRCDSEECQNDTYLGVWKAIPPTRPAVFSAFITKIMRRIAINRYKEKTCKKRIPSELTDSIEDFYNTLPADDSFESSYAAEEVGISISNYLDGLSKRQRYIFIGRFYMAESVEMLAFNLGLTASSVYKELEKIKKGLKIHLERNGIFL